MTYLCVQIAPVAPQCLEHLSKLLLAVCKNPTVPGFNHYLFESVAALIANSAAAQQNTVATLESMLFPPFQIVLTEDVQVGREDVLVDLLSLKPIRRAQQFQLPPLQEFHPYVFQIFSQLIELRAAPLPSIYLDILPPLLTHILWERPGNIPALVRLIRAYLSKAATQIVQQGLLTVSLTSVSCCCHPV